MTISPTQAPSLPLATNEYLPAYQDQLLNILRLYFRQVDNFTQNTIIPPSGTTANRPATELLVGLYYFDTSLGIPIWYNGTNWVNATGVIV